MTDPDDIDIVEWIAEQAAKIERERISGGIGDKPADRRAPTPATDDMRQMIEDFDHAQP